MNCCVSETAIDIETTQVFNDRFTESELYRANLIIFWFSFFINRVVMYANMYVWQRAREIDIEIC